MARDDRQDVNKLRKAGSDLPPRGEGVKEVDTSKGKGKGSASGDVGRDDSQRPSGYKGSHRDRG